MLTKLIILSRAICLNNPMDGWFQKKVKKKVILHKQKLSYELKYLFP